MLTDKISQKIDIHDLRSLDLQIFWALDFLSDEKKDRFSLAEITKFLVEEKKISITKPAIYFVLKKNKKLCNKNNKGYKLMEQGRVELEKITDSKNIILIEPNKPYSGKKIVADKIFNTMAGTIKICDPYFSIKLLDHIYSFFNKNQKIEILTFNIIDKPKGNILRNLGDLRREGYDINIRKYSSSELHDRYIIDENNAWLSGYGFNDIGAKECFFVLLGKDIRQSLLSMFNNRWKSSNNLK